MLERWRPFPFFPWRKSGLALRSCYVISAIRHHLRSSEISKRMALPEHTVVCELTGKTILSDEAATSDVTGKIVSIRSLKTSDISGKRGEADLFARCAFTKVDALKAELASSEVSGKTYRADEQSKSARI